MYLTEKQLQKVQMIQQELLDEFVRVCEDNKLKYYSSYGTLIGAVRHNGSIPWDNDSDVCMPREDFEKFKKLCSQGRRGEL